LSVRIDQDEIKLEPARRIQCQAVIVFFFDQVFADPFQSSPDESRDSWLVIDQEVFFGTFMVLIFASKIGCAIPGFSRSSKKAGDRVDEKREDHRVKAEGKHAVQKCEPPHFARSHLDIGDLTGHADHEGEVSEIEIIGHALFRKIEPAGMLVSVQAIAVAIESMSIAQAENGVHDRP